jgi:hypothetical protein
MSDIIKKINAEEGTLTTTRFASQALPTRKGARPKTIIGPLHVQCNGHGDPKYLKQLLNEILSWPYIEPTPRSSNHLDKVSIRLQETAATFESSAFICGTEFAQNLNPLRQVGTRPGASVKPVPRNAPGTGTPHN